MNKFFSYIFSYVHLTYQKDIVIPFYVKRKINKKIKKQIKYFDPSHYMVEGPTIRLIATQLHWIFENFSFYDENDNPIKIDGFLLKKQSCWKSISKQVEYGIISYSGFCNCKCTFCYLVEGILNQERKILSLQEVQTRINYFNYEESRGFPSAQSYYMEPFFNRNLLTILSYMREKQRENNQIDTFYLSTNGSYLTEDIIAKLAEIKPISLCISLNSAYVESRQNYMLDFNPEVTFSSFALLKKYLIPYSVSMVVGPHMSLKELEDTIFFVKPHCPLEITIHLEGFTKYKENPYKFINFEDYWRLIKQFAIRIQKVIDIPIKVFPSTFFQNDLKANVEAIYFNSPAFFSDINVGDEILEVDGIEVTSKSHCLRLMEKRKSDKVSLLIDRGGEKKQVEIDYGYNLKNNLYPFNPDSTKNLSSGIYMNEDFNFSNLIEIENYILMYNAEEVLVFSSKLINPLVIKMIEKSNFEFSCDNLTFLEMENYLWGGNIMLGDLIVVQDLIKKLNLYFSNIPKSKYPDLILIPESFLVGNGLDMCGKSYMDIKYIYNIPVELIHCRRNFD